MLLFAAKLTMVTKHECVQDVWFGFGAYHDGFGGVIGREN